MGTERPRLRRRGPAAVPAGVLTLEGRYTWADGDLDSDFIGVDPIDLAGLRMSAGGHVLF